MTRTVALRHLTKYTYDRPVRMGPQTVRLRPAPHAEAEISNYQLEVGPVPVMRNAYRDSHGNRLERLLFDAPVTGLTLDVSLTAAIKPINPFDFLLEPEAANWPFAYRAEEHIDLFPYLQHDQPGPRLARFLEATPRQSQPTISFLVDLIRRLRSEIDYTERLEEGTMAPEETLAAALGSCRDSSWLLCSVLRNLGIAARFVSGYLAELPPDPKDDMLSLHAWGEAYIPGAGWIGLDPTSGILCTEAHIPLAATRHYADAAPLTGTHEPTATSITYEMQINRLD